MQILPRLYQSADPSAGFATAVLSVKWILLLAFLTARLVQLQRQLQESDVSRVGEPGTMLGVAFRECRSIKWS